MKTEPFVIERTFNAPVSKVWKAITDKDDMKKWYFDLSDLNRKLALSFNLKDVAHTKPITCTCVK